MPLTPVSDKPSIAKLSLSQPVEGLIADSDGLSGDMIFDTSAAGPYSVIRNNTFGRHRGRDVVTHSTGGLIENNTFGDINWTAIDLAPNFDWHEGPSAHDLTIQGNTFIGGDASYWLGPSQISVKGGATGINIKDNKFHNAPEISIDVGMAYRVNILNSGIFADGTRPRLVPGGVVNVQDSSTITVDGMIIQDTRPNTQPPYVTVANSVDVTVSGVVVASNVPICNLTATPASIPKNGTSTLTASCNPAATSYSWTGGTCLATTASTCTVAPATTTTYTVAGINPGGTGATANAEVTVLPGKTYSDNGDGTVTDPTTGLQWMRCSMGQTWDGTTCTGTNTSIYTWDQANALTGTVTFAGQSDWRVPNIRELQTIVDRSRYDPAVDTATFPETPWSYFWSASASAYPTPTAWLLDFQYGGTINQYTSSGFAVRLVRSGQALGPLLNPARPTSDYFDSSNGTVTHTPTGLMWQRCAKGQTWTGSTCSGSATVYIRDAAVALTDNFAGQTDWRLPTINELESLVDYTISSPTVNATVFANTQTRSISPYFWSASAAVFNSAYAWPVRFDNGVVDYYGKKSSAYQVRLVRAAVMEPPMFGVMEPQTGE